MKQFLILFLATLLTLSLSAQPERILFLGNSYTGVNQLPNLVFQLAKAGGDSVVVETSNPGGCTLGAPPNSHLQNASSQSLIQEGGWDFVVLQEQSQIPTIPYFKDNFMYPGARALDDSIHAYSPCGRTIFFMTWGRRYGGQQCDGSGMYCSPVFTDFSHMQDSLETAYMGIANELNARVSPVGVAWKSVIEDTSIVLHTADNSHPAITGSYLAACVFYASMWERSPVGLHFYAGLDSATARYFQEIAAETVLTDPQVWNIGTDLPQASFSYQISKDTVFFSNQSTLSTLFEWDFGDGSISVAPNPMHIYDSAGTYPVRLIASDGCREDTSYSSVTISQVSTGLSAPVASFRLKVYPNPSDGAFVKVEVPGTEAHFLILDMNGRRIRAGRVENGLIPVKGIASGLYLLRIEFPEGTGGQEKLILCNPH